MFNNHGISRWGNPEGNKEEHPSESTMSNEGASHEPRFESKDTEWQPHNREINDENPVFLPPPPPPQPQEEQSWNNKSTKPALENADKEVRNI